MSWLEMKRTILLIIAVSSSSSVRCEKLDYFFNPSRYWTDKASEACGEAEIAREDYYHCERNKPKNKKRASGVLATDWDKVCSSYKKTYLVANEDCRFAEQKASNEIEKELRNREKNANN